MRSVQVIPSVEVMIVAHGARLTAPKDAIREYIKHRLWREEKIKNALEAGHTEKEDLLAASYDDVPKEMWPWAEHSLNAHLERLGSPVFSD